MKPKSESARGEILNVGDVVTFKVPGLRDGHGTVYSFSRRIVLIDIGEDEPIEVSRKWVERQ